MTTGDLKAVREIAVPDPCTHARGFSRVTILFTAGFILAIGGMLRFSNLSDQAVIVFDAAQVVYNPMVLLKEHYFPYSTARHAYFALVACVYALAGENLTTVSYLSALFGTLAVGLVGILAWSFRRCWLTALLAAGLMAGAYLPVWWSRTGMPYIWAMFVATVSFILLYHSERDEDPRFLWWGALILGYAVANHYSMIFAVASYAVWEVFRRIEDRQFQFRPLTKRLVTFAALFALMPAIFDSSVRFLRFFSGYDAKLAGSTNMIEMIERAVFSVSAYNGEPNGSSNIMQWLWLFFSNADADVNQSYIRELAAGFLVNIHHQGAASGFTYYLRVLWHFEGAIFASVAVLSLIYMCFLWRRHQNKTGRFIFLFTATPLILHSIAAGTGSTAVPRALVVAYPTLMISIAWFLVDMIALLIGSILAGKGPKTHYLARTAVTIGVILGFGIYGWENTHSLRALRTYYPAAQSYLRESAKIQHVGVFGNVALWTLLSGRKVRFIYSREDFDGFQRLTGEKIFILQHKAEGRLSWAADLNGVPYKSFPNPVERSVIVSAEDGPGRIPTQDELNRLGGEVRVYIFQ